MFLELSTTGNIVLYSYIAFALIAYALLSKIAFFGIPLLRWQWRAMLAALSPFLLLGAIILGIAGIGIVGVYLLMRGVSSLLGRKQKLKPSHVHRVVIRFGER